MKYSDIISIKSSFRRSTNLLYDTNCDSYILSTSSIEALRRIFITNTSNSIAITGPFGSGKSSLLVYLESLLSKKEEFATCIEKLKEKDSEIFSHYNNLVGDQNKGFFSIKVVGEHLSFKKVFLSTLMEFEELKETIKFMNENENVSFSSLLSRLNKEVMKLGYTGVIILIDELGKIIEYASEKYVDSDIHALQDLAEFVNKQNNYRLVVALHKSFKDYVQNTTHLSFTEWDKIQGRFENIVFQDDFYELMHIFEEAITVEPNESIKNVQEKVVTLFDAYKKHVIDKNIPFHEASLKKLAPLHPFASLSLFHIFSKHFQNQRSIFSFLSAQEPYSFQNFINQERIGETLYSLPMLFDYINYLSNAYSVTMIDKESWKLANEYLDSANVLSEVQQKIIKSIALVSAFKLEHLIQLDAYGLELALTDEKSIAQEIKELEQKGLILHKIATKSYALIEEASLDINQELIAIMKSQIKTDYKSEINKIISDDKVLAKRFYINTGTSKFFTKVFIDSDTTTGLNLEFKLIYVGADVDENEIIKMSQNNQRSVYVTLPLTRQLRGIADQSMAIEVMLKRKDIQSNKILRTILSNMLNSNKNEIDTILDVKEILYFAGESLPYSSEILQQSISKILESTYPYMPLIVNDLVNTINRETIVPFGIKKLFEHMLKYENDDNLRIEKTPPEKAIYLSVIKKCGLHSYDAKTMKWKFTNPKESNFIPVWEKLTTYIKEKKLIELNKMIEILQVEPFGLNEDAAKFVVFLFLIINESNIHFFRENTYQFDFDIDQVMDLWKNTKLYTLRWNKLSRDEEAIFAKYIQIFDHYFDLSYSKENIKYVFQKLFTKLNALPKYCNQTKKLSDKAIKLRSGVLASKEPHETFFEIFPTAMGYTELNTTNVDNFIVDFKQAFNEIVFSYKNMLLDLEETVADAFDLSIKHYPFGNELEIVLEKYLNEHNDKDANDVYRMCTTANDMVFFLNGLSLVLQYKKVDDAFDKDINDLKQYINSFAIRVLSKLDIVELINNRPVDVKKLKISTINGDNNLVMTVKNEKLSELSNIAVKVSYDLPHNLTKDEKLYLITLMLEEATKDMSE